ncbi:MAG: FliI/YscN family ATPase [Bacteroidetes bacterium]|nr:FliI/YscN family ATPase [Rhodothermia bacterium]MCX7906384.1 FliI/YscN family ATPase [Bacteroidota bacterium]
MRWAELHRTLEEAIDRLTVEPIRYGRVRSVVGLLIEAVGLDAPIGALCQIELGGERVVSAEVVGIREDVTLLMPLEEIVGLRPGAWVRRSAEPLRIPVGRELLGRVVDAAGRPLDGQGPIFCTDFYPVHRDPPPAMSRPLIREALWTGVRAIDGLLTIGKGQRVGIFAGSGVGKSVLMGMIARRSAAQVNVITLIGERGREVREFIEDNLGPEGLARSVVVAVTSDQAAMSRVKGAFVATAIAEYFRDQGLDVLLMMDSLTRVAMAQREIGLASGEPPTTKGYTPSVFALLPRLLERAGASARGTITGLYTVLVEGDDFNDPVADAVRGILDGHIVLSRRLAHQGHYPAIDVLASISRVMPRIVSPAHRRLAQEAQALLATYAEAEDLINIGAYVRGSNPRIDWALERIEALRAFLRQDVLASAEERALLPWLEHIVRGEEQAL